MSLAARGGLLLALVDLWSPGAAAAPLSPDAVVRYALVHHPDAVAAHAAPVVARAERAQDALFLANPTVEASFGAGGAALQVAQPLSPLGAGWPARRALALAADAADLRARRADLALAADARSAWIAAAAASRRAALAEEALALMGQLRRSVEAHAAQGQASDLDVRLARLEEAHALSQALDARAAAGDARRALAAFHPDGASAELGDPLDAAPSATDAPDVRSDLAAARVAAASASAGLARERASALDLVEVGATVTVGSTPSAGPFVAWSLPLWGRNQGATAAAHAALDVARAETDRVERQVAADQQAADALAALAESGLARLGDADADARAALTAIDSGAASGALDLSTAVLLRGDVVEGWTAAIDARASAAEARVRQLLSHDDPSLLGGPR